MIITQQQKRFILDTAVFNFLASNPHPHSPSGIAWQLHTDYRQTLAACHRLHRAGRIQRVYFTGANLSVYWYENA